MTLTAMTAPLPVKAEVRIPCKHLPASNGFVAGILVLAMMTMIIVTVWSTARLLPAGLSPYPSASACMYDCGNVLEYRPSIADTLSLGHPAFSSTALVARE